MRWQYIVQVIPDPELAKFLEQAGMDGFELVTCVPVGIRGGVATSPNAPPGLKTAHHCILKRGVPGWIPPPVLTEEQKKAIEAAERAANGQRQGAA